MPLAPPLDDLQRDPQRGERGPQLVPQHRQKKVLGVIGAPQFLGLLQQRHLQALPLGDVRDGAHPLAKGAGLVPAGDAPDGDVPILARSTADAILRAE